MTITIIAYRPNFEEYSMGCSMSSTDSELQIHYCYSSRDAAEVLANIELEEEMYGIHSAAYDSYAITILQDGKPIVEEHTWVKDMRKEVARLTKGKITVYREQKARDDKKQKEDDLAKQKARDLKLFKKLQEQFADE